MRNIVIAGAIAALLGGLACADVAAAGGKKHRTVKPAPETSGYSRRVGGYSYSYPDAIIDYRDATILEGPNIYEPTGPLDNDMFFDSNVTSFGSDAPYMN